MSELFVLSVLHNTQYLFKSKQISYMNVNYEWFMNEFCGYTVPCKGSPAPLFLG